MSLKKSDVKNHLSTRAGTNVLPFRSTLQPDAGIPSENKLRDTEVSAANFSAGPVQSSSDKASALPGGALVSLEEPVQIAAAIEKPQA